MFRLAKTFALATLLSALGSVAASAAAPVLEARDLEAWMDGRVPFAIENGDIAGAVVSVVKDGKLLFEKGYGYSDIEHKTPMDPERTLMRVGSTSKLFTWTAVMQQVEQGKLDLNQDINSYLDFKIDEKFGKKITLLDLMHHRGGFEEGLKDILMTDPKAAPSTEDYLKKHPRPMLFAPGEVPAYSNYGTALAGYIVQRVSGEPFERYVGQHIFSPLGMNNSSFDQPLPEALAPDVSQGYRTASGPARPFEIVTTGPAGGLSATAADMAKFMIAHLQDGRLDAQHEILRPETAKLMHTPSEAAPPGFATMAHGFFHDRRNGHLVIGHGGDTIIFHSEFDLLPEDGVGIFFSFNSRGREDAVYGAREALIKGFLDRYFPAPAAANEPAALSSAAQDAGEIAGNYESSRRIEDGFLSVFYLLQQTSIAANPDGTIFMPARFGQGSAVFREIEPKTWQQIDAPRRLILTSADGLKTVIDSEDPTSVLQTVPLRRSAALNMPIMLMSAAILVLTVIFWPVLAIARGRNPDLSVEGHKWRRSSRIAASILTVYLLAWILWVLPMLSIELGRYNAGNDWIVRGLQLAGLVALAAAGWSVWSAVKLFRLPGTLASKIWAVAVAVASVGIVWIAFVGHLIGANLNY